MTELSKTPLLKARIPDGETFKDDEKAWEYFGEMNFDVILANPPFAGEMKDKKMLSQYDLAKPALKRAKDKQAKEERDVLFIERIVKMLRPGGRAAIVLPQGKFNNSSLAFIREWVLRKARLLAVVGLHGNSFKPHTGTKTSVLFLQKYTQEQLDEIVEIQNEVEAACPDYASQITDLLAQYDTDLEIPEEQISEEIFELLLEEFPEPEAAEETDDTADNTTEEENTEPQSLEEKLEAIDERIAQLRRSLLQAKTKLDDLNDDLEALETKQKDELAIAKENWSGSHKDWADAAKKLKEEQKQAIKTLKDLQKETAKTLKAEIKTYENAIPLAEEEKLLLTNKGKLKLLAQNDDSIKKLRNRYIDAEVAKRLNYPIFMAVSEYGGKNNSGDYEYLFDEYGNIVEDTIGNPEIKQDLVNHKITREDLLTRASELADEECNIAEAFVKFAKKQKFDFWKD